MRKNRRKLHLSKTTIVQLTGPELRGAVTGDGWSDQSLCPTTTPTDCKRCAINPPGASVLIP